MLIEIDYGFHLAPGGGPELRKFILCTLLLTTGHFQFH